jgi:pyruvate dehydrogenase E1 component alpha subunit
MKTKEELIAFEDEVKQMFLDGKLRSPVHLSGGNEESLIEIFKEIKPNDWVFTNYRSHYHALLKGVPEDRLRKWILDNKSIHFMDSEYKMFSSAIVGGCLPIALGVAMAIKRKNEQHVLVDAYTLKAIEDSYLDHVYVFIGDMTASTGVFHDCFQYAAANNLPITFVIEDNGLSTDTVTTEAWGMDDNALDNLYYTMSKAYPGVIKYYKYKRTRPHYGVGKWIDFGDKNKHKEDKGF